MVTLEPRGSSFNFTNVSAPDGSHGYAGVSVEDCGAESVVKQKMLETVAANESLPAIDDYAIYRLQQEIYNAIQATGYSPVLIQHLCNLKGRRPTLFSTT